MIACLHRAGCFFRLRAGVCLLPHFRSVPQVFLLIESQGDVISWDCDGRTFGRIFFGGEAEGSR